MKAVITDHLLTAFWYSFLSSTLRHNFKENWVSVYLFSSFILFFSRWQSFLERLSYLLSFSVLYFPILPFQFFSFYFFMFIHARMCAWYVCMRERKRERMKAEETKGLNREGLAMLQFPFPSPSAHEHLGVVCGLQCTVAHVASCTAFQ